MVAKFFPAAGHLSRRCVGGRGPINACLAGSKAFTIRLLRNFQIVWHAQEGRSHLYEYHQNEGRR
jgi:hypothetical protein